MGKTMYVNFRKDEPRQFAGHTVTPMDDCVMPVEMLFNENSTAGEVRPLADGYSRLRYEDGTVKPFDFVKNENLVLGHEDLSETGALILKDKDERGWEMTDTERRPYMDMILEEGPFDEDTIAETKAQADMFGMESLRESQQVLVGMDEDDLFAVQDFMDQCGMMHSGVNLNDYTTYGQTDTGRYLQIALKDNPDEVLDVYEGAPSGNLRQFYNMHPGEGKVTAMSIEDGGYEVKGIYIGRPFQDVRDRIQADHDAFTAQMDIDPSGPTGPVGPVGPAAPGSAMARMQAMVGAMDEKDEEEPGVEPPSDGGFGYDE